MSTDRELEEALKILSALEEYKKYNKLDDQFQDEGPFRRELYPRQLEFFEFTKDCVEVAFIAANKTGKSHAGAYYTALSLTGRYPHWWKGRVYKAPVEWWVAGITAESTRDIGQSLLLGRYTGDVKDFGTGMIPKDCIGRVTMQAHNPGCVDEAFIKHFTNGVFDGWSVVQFKAYKQGEDKFQGTNKDGIWLDEEPRERKIYSECLMRIMVGRGQGPGMLCMTFTPLFGISDVVKSFLDGGRFPKDGRVHNKDHMGRNAAVVKATWDDVPHLTETMKQTMLATLQPHERAARSRGEPGLGSGIIFQFMEEDITCEPFKIPGFWPRCYGLDITSRKFDAVWVAKNPDTNELFVYAEYSIKDALASTQVAAIKSKGDWIPGVVDDHISGLMSVVDRIPLLRTYQDLGLRLKIASKGAGSVEAGIVILNQMLAEGKLKIFNSCKGLLEEFRLYHRDESGRPVAEDNDLLDALKYAVTSGLVFAKCDPALYGGWGDDERRPKHRSTKNPVTGY